MVDGLQKGSGNLKGKIQSSVAMDVYYPLEWDGWYLYGMPGVITKGQSH